MTILAKIKLVNTKGEDHFPLLTKEYNSDLVPVKGMEFDSVCFTSPLEITDVVLNMDKDVYDVYLVDDNTDKLSIKDLKAWYMKHGWTEEPDSFS